MEKFTVLGASDEDELTWRICALAAAGTSSVASAITAYIRLIIYLSLPTRQSTCSCLPRMLSMLGATRSRTFSVLERGRVSYGQVSSSVFEHESWRPSDRGCGRWRR